jgi:UDP-2,3-diacylglucosamine hydrolase
LHWLNSIQPEAHALFLLGDIFDFWFEYKHVVPKGFMKIQSKLASLVAQGVSVYLFPGNRDWWMQDYFERELGIKIIRSNAVLIVGHVSLLVGHGDEIGGSANYRCLKQYVYNSAFIYWIARQLPPALLFSLTSYLTKSRTRDKDQPRLPDRIFNFCKDRIEPFQHHDYYIFGHLHYPYSKPIHEHSTYYNVGDWLTSFSYVVFDGGACKLMKEGMY